jgi:hypothetical protein
MDEFQTETMTMQRRLPGFSGHELGLLLVFPDQSLTACRDSLSDRVFDGLTILSFGFIRDQRNN